MGKSLETVICVNFSSNSTKTIRLFALDFYEVIVDSAFGLIITVDFYRQKFVTLINLITEFNFSQSQNNC